MKIGLAASLNGAGHFGRILAIGEMLLKRNHSVSLVVGERQIGLDTERIRNFEASKNSEVFVISNPLGLEGPQWGVPSSQNPESIPNAVRRAFGGADFVISDNSVWPLQITNKTILMAQFLWLDYWRQNSADIQTDLEKEEAFLCEKAQVRLAIPIFQIKSSVVPESITLPLKLFSYPRDALIARKPVTREIWVAGGTTGLNSVTEKFPATLPDGFKVVSRETFHLSDFGYRPAAIAGRPGLGSIRDALGSGVPFLPLWGGEDFELEHNSRALADWNLVWSDWSRSSVAGLNRPTLENDLVGLRQSISNFVESEFVTLDQAVNQILETAERALHD